MADTPEGLRIEIPGEWTAGKVGTVALCALFLAGGAWDRLPDLLARPNARDLLVLLGLWGCFGWAAAAATAAALSTEVVLLDGATLRLRRQWRGFRRERRFELGRVRRLRSGLGPPPTGAMSPGNRFTPIRPAPCVAFRYGRKTVRFGAGLAMAEADDIVDEIERRFPGTTDSAPEGGRAPADLR